MQYPADPDYLRENLHFPSLAAKALSEGAGEVLVFGFLSLVCFQDAFSVACPFRVYFQARTPFCTSCSCTSTQIITLSSPRATELLVRHLMFWRETADAGGTLVVHSHPDRKADSAPKWLSS
jgi:hypothetical protein